MMHTPKDILGHLPKVRVLDVATGRGDFIQFLLEGLSDYSEIIGIDSNPSVESAFTSAIEGKTGIHFQTMDALNTTFDDHSFDLVCISNSLHHFDEPMLVLKEMQRVLRPGGTFLVSEMYRDDQTETQQTHVELHHWWAAVDRLSGIAHHETYTRDELIRLVETLDLFDLQQYDLSDTTYDPRSIEIFEGLNPAIDRYIQRAEGHPELQEHGEQLRQRLREIGFHSATSLLMLGGKRG